MSTYRAMVARAAALAQLVFVGGWLVIGALEGHGYRRRRETWAGPARPTKLFGFVTIALLLVTGATTGSAVGGLTQRVAAAFVTGGVALLAWRAARVETARVPPLAPSESDARATA
jgi:hypothetical protein